MSDQRIAALIAECQNEAQNCLYTSTTLYIWLRRARRIRHAFVIAPIILGALATWSVLDQPDSTWLVGVTATFALLAGLFPAVFEALKLDTQVDEIARQAAAFKNLQDRFRQASTVTALGPFENFQHEFAGLMERLEEARSTSITPPERCFAAARKKIHAGHYDFDKEQSSGPTFTDE